MNVIPLIKLFDDDDELHAPGHGLLTLFQFLGSTGSYKTGV